MATRAYWSGYIRLSLVHFPVQLYPATAPAREFPLHQIDRKSGERVRYKKIVPGKGEVENEDIVKGYEYEKGQYVTFDADELEKLKLESKHTIELVQFVDAREIDAIYYDKPYFVAADGELAEEAYRVVRDALRDSKSCGIGQIVLSGKERLAALKPCGRGLLLETLRYGDEIKRAATYFEGISEKAAPKEQIDLAKELIERKTAAFNPDKFKDHYDRAMRDLIKEKMSGQKPSVKSEPPRGGAQIINLMDALKRSLKGKVDKPAPAGKKRAAPARKKSTSSRAKVA